MFKLCSALCCAALLLGATSEVLAPVSPASPGATGAVHGDYVEARTASVFVGACHFQGEYDTRGREAVLAWRIAGGEHAGVSLSGLTAVAAVTGEANLAEPEAKRRSVVYLPAEAGEAERAALLAWLRAEHGAALGEVVAVRAVAIDFAREADRFDVRAGDAVRLAGSALADRACCTMPFEVWYEPFAPLAAPVVGEVERFRSSEPALAVRWSVESENSAFLGRFPAPPEPAAPN